MFKMMLNYIKITTIASTETTLKKVRDNYWIMPGRQTVRKIILNYMWNVSTFKLKRS